MFRKEFITFPFFFRKGYYIISFKVANCDLNPSS